MFENEEEQPLLVDEDQMKELEQTMLQVFENMYWTRLIVMDDFLPLQQDRYELGTDIAVEVDEMYRIDGEHKPELELLFDPQAF